MSRLVILDMKICCLWPFNLMLLTIKKHAIITWCLVNCCLVKAQITMQHNSSMDSRSEVRNWFSILKAKPKGFQSDLAITCRCLTNYIRFPEAGVRSRELHIPDRNIYWLLSEGSSDAFSANWSQFIGKIIHLW